MTDKPDPDLELVKKACLELGEHFDAVQIFATRHEEALKQGTIRVAYGSGNFMARYGHCLLWVERQKAIELDDIIRFKKEEE